MLDQDNEPTAKGTVPRGRCGHRPSTPIRSPCPESRIAAMPGGATARSRRSISCSRISRTKGFSYADCERVRLVPAEKPGGGPVLIVRFSGSVITEAVIEGRHLHSLYHAIGLHQMPWIWEHPAPADFTNDKATLISRITFREVER